MAELDSVAKIKKLVFDSVFKRAQDIAASNSLLNISFEGDFLETCTADCKGSSSLDVYKLNIHIIGAKVIGKCSCPASAKAKDGLCKHVIAILLRRSDRLLEKSASFSRARKQEDFMDEYPIERIGSPEEEEEKGELEASPSKLRKPMTDENALVPVLTRQSPKHATSKRALPAWMLGVAGYAAASGESSKASKPKKRAAVERPASQPPRPTKRTRRPSQPLKVTNDPDQEEDPGEVDVAEPVEDPFDEDEPVVEDGDEAVELFSVKTRSGRSRKPMRPTSRDEMEIQKQHAGEIECNKGDENVGTRKGKGKGQPQPRTKSRRVVGKLIEVESDLSDNEKVVSPSCNDEGGVLENVTDDDLMLLAQQHVANENGRISQGAPSAPDDNVSEKQLPAKKSSRFSLNKWKEISSEKLDTGDFRSLTAGSLDLETLKEYTQNSSQILAEQSTQGAGDEDYPSVRTTSAAEGDTFTVHEPIDPAMSVDRDSVANDMLGLIFGSSLSACVVPKSPGPRTVVSSDIGGGRSNSGIDADGFIAVKASPSYREASAGSAPKILPAAVTKNTEDLSVEFKPKKKSSLKDKIKMLLD
ncbi:hypothetical protein MPTK1_8g04070 [Marchantia polymorpha subsp. ruderalis]|uniref:SWIM-type domain-containing protein n=1 Tax=Marchantia polymorpha TaxID=3197 RepID=A0A2R6XJI5_MARPO|nr:hypothetical protein MARPO_0012s0196 [Marchantia polymorpha]BBN18627.1 hypothetical protein Mp_8g04070 [Marchantia polymorpha subsp. ruderalis]|eukprot:PTQ46274.1 hypothetical protein MARPO_0012s0196 [Marchantia polymorpha]